MVCPSCGGRQKQILSSSIFQTRCEYCGSTILIPRELTGLARRCHNHPDRIAMGICHDCGQTFCEDCLVVWVQNAEKKYICPECRDRRRHTLTLEFRFLMVPGLVVLSVGLLLEMLSPASVLGIVPLTLGFLCLYVGGMDRIDNGEIGTMKQELQEQGAAGEGLREECPHCHALYFYNLHLIRPDWTVACQNCGRDFKLRGTLPVG